MLRKGSTQLAGLELQGFQTEPGFSILGARIAELADPKVAAIPRASPAVLDACLAASEIYEYALTLTNSVYRCAPLSSLKLLHAMQLEERAKVAQGIEYVEELREFLKTNRIKNPGFVQQLEALEARLRSENPEKPFLCFCM